MRKLLPLIVFLLMAAGFAVGLLARSTAQAVEESSDGMVRVDVLPAAQELFSAGQPIEAYARLYAPDGSEILLVPPSTLESLSAQSVFSTVRQLDATGSSGDYYLAWVYTEALLERVRADAVLLDVVGEQAVIRATLEQAEALHETGVTLRRLSLHPLLNVTVDAALQDTLPVPFPQVREMVDQVSSTQVAEYVRGLSGDIPIVVGGNSYQLETRYSYATVPITRATRYVYDHLTSLGLDVGYHYFLLDGIELRNVVAEQRGVSEPEKIVLITAHLDSISHTPGYSPYLLAPGADDNASGSTGVLIAADILSQHDFAYTIRYILFTGEEQWLKGSAPYAYEAALKGEQILAVLNLDMIAFNPDGIPDFDVHVRPGVSGDRAIAEKFVQVVDAYNLNLNARIAEDGLNFSDHASFWEYGYSAVLGIEKWVVNNPYYHQVTDRFNTLDLAFFTQAVKAAVGTLAHLAVLDEPNISGVILQSDAAVGVAGASIAATAPGYSQTTISSSDGSYQMMVPEGTYSLVVNASGYAPVSVANVLVDNPLILDFDLCQLLAGVSWYASPLPPRADEPVYLFASYTAGSSPVTFSWNVAGVEFPAPASAVVTYTFADSGVYPIRLSATNTCSGPVEASYSLAVDGRLVYLPGIFR